MRTEGISRVLETSGRYYGKTFQGRSHGCRVRCRLSKGR